MPQRKRRRRKTEHSGGLCYSLLTTWRKAAACARREVDLGAPDRPPLKWGPIVGFMAFIAFGYWAAWRTGKPNTITEVVALFLLAACLLVVLGGAGMLLAGLRAAIRRIRTPFGTARRVRQRYWGPICKLIVEGSEPALPNKRIQPTALHVQGT